MSSNSPIRDLLTSFRSMPALAGRELLDVGVDEHSAARPPGRFDLAGLDPSRPIRLQHSTATENESDVIITVFSAVPCTLLFTGLVKRPNGDTQPIGPNGAGYVISVLGDRVPRSFPFSRGGGVEPIGFSIVATSLPAVPLGACWVIGQQSRTNADASRVITNTYFSGPVSDVQPLGWPGSPLLASTSLGYVRTIGGTTPAIGANINEVVPTGARWELLSFTVPFTTSGVIGNRTPFFLLGTKANVFVNMNIPANTAQTLEFGPGLPLANSLQGNLSMVPIPIGIQLTAGEVIQTVTVGLDPVGDHYGQPFYAVVERLDP